MLIRSLGGGGGGGGVGLKYRPFEKDVTCRNPAARFLENQS